MSLFIVWHQYHGKENMCGRLMWSDMFYHWRTWWCLWSPCCSPGWCPCRFLPVPEQWRGQSDWRKRSLLPRWSPRLKTHRHTPALEEGTNKETVVKVWQCLRAGVGGKLEGNKVIRVERQGRGQVFAGVRETINWKQLREKSHRKQDSSLFGLTVFMQAVFLSEFLNSSQYCFLEIILISKSLPGPNWMSC